ncbi:MAG: alpha/beta hydrolase [Lachnospiraceae bacterium]|nr:alpha/beta hydrolase [Lachnospiraceae bacterium]
MYLREENYSTAIKEARNDLDKIKISGYYGGMDKTHIYFEYYKNTKRKESIVISHGFCENLLKYTELITYFYNKGYSVYALEHRGMARSTHLGKDESQVHVDSFDHYVYDLKRFVDDIVKKEAQGEKLHLYAHSLGGLIGTRYIQMYPEDFEKVILCSPFFGINMDLPDKFIKICSRVLIQVGQSKNYTLIHKKYDKFPEFDEMHTNSRARYEFNKEIHAQSSQYRMLGGSYKWIYECIMASEQVFKKENLEKIEADVLLITCGQDTMVDTSVHKKFANLIFNCRTFEIPESKHEPFFETDDIIAKFYRMVFDFLDK